MASKAKQVVGNRGQLTIPVTRRRAMGIEPGDKVAITLVDGELRTRRVGTIVEHTTGSLKSHEPPETAERLREMQKR